MPPYRSAAAATSSPGLQQRRGRPSSPPGRRRRPGRARRLPARPGRSPGPCASGCRCASTRSPCARPAPPGCRSRWRRSARRSPRWPGRRSWPAWMARVAKPCCVVIVMACSLLRHAAADRRLAGRCVPVLDQVDPRDDVDHLAVADVASTPVLPASSRRYASSRWTSTSSCGSGRAMTSPTVTLARVAVVVQDAGQRHLLDAADRLAVLAAPAAARCRPPASARSPSATVASGLDASPAAAAPRGCEQVADRVRRPRLVESACSRPASASSKNLLR